MDLAGIVLYCARAARFAATVGALYAAVRILGACRRGQKPDAKRLGLELLAVCWLAALAEIIALRGLVPQGRQLQPVPLGTVGPLAAAAWAALCRRAAVGALHPAAVRQILWPLVYNVAGNLLWFVPLGMLGPLLCSPCPPARWPDLRRPGRCLAAGAAVSALLELTQYLLATGATDLDDVWLNALGALLGWLAWKLGSALCRRSRGKTPAAV